MKKKPTIRTGALHYTGFHPGNKKIGALPDINPGIPERTMKAPKKKK